MFSLMICIIKYDGRRKQFLEFRFLNAQSMTSSRSISWSGKSARLESFYIALHHVFFCIPPSSPFVVLIEMSLVHFRSKLEAPFNEVL